VKTKTLVMLNVYFVVVTLGFGTIKEKLETGERNEKVGFFDLVFGCVARDVDID